MPTKIALAALALSATLGGCQTLTGLATDRVGDATLRTASGTPVGTVQLVGREGGLALAVGITGMEPGVHGFHMHAVGKCEGPDFGTAGGHLNPTSRRHGSAAANGPHMGDLPNLEIGSTRTLSTDIDLVGDRETLLKAIFDGDGTAVVVHADADDYRTDPSGNSGKRIACGVLGRAR